jgi:uncharacterized protein YdeI (BOF family)
VKENVMKDRVVFTLFLVVMIVVFAGVAGAQSQKGTKTPEPSKGVAPEPGAKSTSALLTGTVLETLDAGPYTYLRLKIPKGETWAAVNKANVKKGSKVTIVNPIPMDGFESKTLKRKFDRIVFGSLAGASASNSLDLASGHGSSSAASSQNMAQSHANIGNAPADAAGSNVKKAEGANGKKVAEIFSAKSSLKDTRVEVRGKVVKYNPGIMGKNWIHIRDGSGSREKKDDDITVTTLDSAAVGDTVLVKGTVRLNRDFGAGYIYPVIIEDARVSK